MGADEVVVRVRGDNGAEIDLTVPPEGTYQRELFDAKVANGTLTVLEPATEPKPARAAKRAAPEPPADLGD